VLSGADAAMYQAKQVGKNRIVWLDSPDTTLSGIERAA